MMADASGGSNVPIREIVRMQAELSKVEKILLGNKQVPLGLRGHVEAAEHYIHERAQIFSAIEAMASFKDANVAPDALKPLMDAAVLLNPEHRDLAKHIPAGSEAYKAYETALEAEGIDKRIAVIIGLQAVEIPYPAENRSGARVKTARMS